MQTIRGAVLHCGRYGCVVRLEDGRLANLASEDSGLGTVRRAFKGQPRPEFSFVVSEESGRLYLRLAGDESPESPESVAARSLNAPSDASPQEPADEPSVSASTPLDEKIIEYLRQTEDWDPHGALAGRALDAKQARADRLLPLEARARRQYRESPKKPPRKKR